MINQNKLAKEIAGMEGLKVQVNIAQIKEVMRCMLEILSKQVRSSGSWEDVIKLIDGRRKK